MPATEDTIGGGGAQLGELAGVPFRDPARAALNCKRIAQHVPAKVLQLLPNLLAETPDPDAALNGFERLVTHATDERAQLLRTFEQQPQLVFYALTVFAYSQFLGDTLSQNPDVFAAMQREHGFQRSHHVDEFRESLARFRSRSLEPDVAVTLARFKRREYIRIMLRDVLGIATLAETTAEISALADVLIAEALREAQSLLRNRYGAPRTRDSAGRWIEPGVAVLSLGKLGGTELNYSSDVDLLFLYYDDETGEAAGETISNREYFIRLAQMVTDILSRSTREGPVFRIDLRLRPQGREGEPAVGLSHALRYYSRTAHDWEIQAMIKARPSAGDVGLARTFLRGVEPYIYKREVNFPAIETALNSLQKIKQHHRSATIDVKTDRGGIRDIEFLAQCLQRVYGGSEPWLRARGTLFSIHKLHDKAHLSGKDFHELSTAYEFLRKVEHRLQLRTGQQTHRLPHAREQLETLWRLVGGPTTSAAHAMGAAAVEAEDPAAEMVRAVRQRMAAVAEIYHRIIHQQQVHKEMTAGAREASAAPAFQLEAALPEPGSEHSFQQMLSRLAADAPELYAIASRRDLTASARRNLHRFLSAAFTTSERYAVAVRHPQALERALALFDASEFLTDMLVTHPEEITALAYGAAPAATADALFETHADPRAASDPLPDFIARSAVSPNEKLALLRQRYRHRVFASASRDVVSLRNVYDSLAETTAAAYAAIRAAAAIADLPDSMAVFALGRLGTREFDLGSDADLLFVRADESDEAAAKHAVEQLVQALAAYTREGTVFSVDSRLRPHGMQGELLITPSQLAGYFAREAQPWEALTYTKLSLVTGPEELAARTVEAVGGGLPRFADDPEFAAAVRAMRTRLERSDVPANFKLGPGGFYDIDFAASYLLVRHEGAAALAGRTNIRETLGQLAARGVLDEADRALLDQAAELLRTTEHVVRLVQGRPRKTLPTAAHAREVIERLTAAILRREFPAGLEAGLRESAARVRAVFERVLA